MSEIWINNKSRGHNKPDKNRDQRKLAFEDTQSKCTNGFYGELTKSESVLRTLQSHKDLSILPTFEKTNIQVLNEDVLEVARMMVVDEHLENVLVLNLASDKRAGGGVAGGSMAQEEELFRRTNYFMSLFKDPRWYPLAKTDVIYTPNVVVVKGKDYSDLEQRFSVSMLAASGIRQPVLTADGNYNDKDFDLMFNTIENIFKTAYTYGHSNLILGAIGAGVFRNPPAKVAEIYNVFLKRYKGCFANIYFAVLSKKDNNYDVFNEVIYRG